MGLKNTPISKSPRIKVGITIGDPSGIGPNIAAKALKGLEGKAEFVVIGDRWVFDKIVNYKLQIADCRFIDLANVRRKNFSFGKIKAEYGRAAIEYLDKALELISQGAVDCLVTCPVSKEAVCMSGFKFCGHTEYLARKSNTKDFLMMLLNRYLKISLVTRHIRLKDVPGHLTQERIYKTTLLTHQSLKKLFAISQPRLVICGLNPHASDNGLIGDEESRLIRPALAELRKKGIFIDGPLAADTAMLKAKQKQYDAVIAIYHDQALIPLKISGGLSGVNITLGLPFVRTSPLHGTGFDIAARPDLPDPASLIAAINLAIQCSLNQRKD